ncbi:glycosyltransferase family 2 protein [Lichenicola cladoniae]|uniref:Glycosyltransferase family 2 protein n=1 Tax=Lichenicola cladoniae TaxID=1484109 RepID=A0A6M8HTG1_9PROT|nr:glycosyltransferase family 2 protein [Lichenicola cladoniae]NPD67559.1 glycosyltransferase family 2 protein [Acetobacteraceae bacterium]QKE91793.1 glycosyltransferase family 2 protein [Lichenicola cladoniae]
MTSRKLGIAVTTYNRCDILLSGLEAIKRLTSIDYELVVCDDGSVDDTVSALTRHNITVVGKTNKGIAWNKNRGLFYLSQHMCCDTIILLDDDAHPVLMGWEQEWIAACDRFGHVNYIPPHYRESLLAGKMTATNPGVGPTVGGMAIGQTAQALSCVGYMDVRFGRYGHEHSDFTGRFARAGFGGFKYQGLTSIEDVYYLIEGGIELVPSESSGTPHDLSQNGALLGQLANDPIYRSPWRTDAEMRDFLSEMPIAFWGAQGGLIPPREAFSASAYLTQYDDVRDANNDALEHYVRAGRSEGRAYGRATE